MVTISHLVGKIIERKPFIEEALSRGIINYGALADEIKPEIEQELKKEVNHSAVMMAVRRYAEKSQERLFRRVRFREDTDITLRSDLIEITIVKTPDSGEMIRRLYDFIDFKKGDFISIVQGMYEITIITNKKHEKNFLKTIKKDELKNVIKDLSSLAINIPEDSTEVIGLFYIITKALAWENISIVEIVSTWSEMTYIIKTEDAPFAFRVIKRLIEENR